MSTTFLNEKQKQAVVEAARTWPKTLTPRELIDRLDKLARAVIEASA